MKKLDPKDMAEVLSEVKNDLGCYFAGKEAEERIRKLPNTNPGTYFDAIIGAVIRHYESQTEEE